MEELAELVGVIIGDGNICYISKIRKYYVEITGNPKSEEEYYKYLSLLFLSVVGKSGTIAFRGMGLRIRVYSKNFVEFLINNLGMYYGMYKLYNIEIPKIIIKSSRKINYLCLRGIFDTDGSFFVSMKDGKSYPSIEIVTCSEILANQIYYILKTGCFRVNLRFRNDQNYTFKRVSVVSLYGFEQVKRWFNVIGSSNSAKYKKYESFIKNFK